MKVAIVHDWLVNYGGAERVVEEMLKLYPDADIFTLVYDEKKMGKIFPKEKVHTSFVQKLPMSTRLYTKLLTLMPKAFESFDFSGYDLVLCSSSSCAKGVITPPDVPHICYIHSPMRYAWDQFFEYRKRSGRLTSFFMNRWMPSIRLWDFISSQRIDSLIANSKYIARRIQKYWNLSSTVIYPPVDTGRLSPNNKPAEDFYVVFSRFVPYKRIDLAISACGKLGKKLVVIGGGSQEAELKALAKEAFSSHPDDVKFTGRISDSEVQDYLQRCKAMIFSAEEDFGIIPVEVQACGRPVIAFGKGGALETVRDGVTGVFFDKQETESVCTAIKNFEDLSARGTFVSEKIVEHAKSFSAEHFRKELLEHINKVTADFGGKIKK